MKRSISRMMVVFAGGLLLASCGDNSLGGGVGEFKTVQVSAVANTARLESDVLTGNTCAVTGSTGGTFLTDSVSVDITSTAFAGVTNPLNVKVERITVRYAPAKTNSPVIPDTVISTIGQTVTPGGTLTIDVPVAPESLKLQLVNNFNLQPCSATLYEYFAIINLEVLEVGTGQRSTVTASLNVAFADRTT